MPDSRKYNRSFQPAILWVVLVLLVSAQVSFAFHHHDHSMSETGETCEVCLQFERDDDAVSHATLVLTPSVPSAGTTEIPVVFNRPETFASYRSRASP